MKKNNNRKGFTIVELVIVIAVIAILAAVLIPTFSGIVTKAKESAALQEVKSAYTATLAEDLSDNNAENDVVYGETVVVQHTNGTFITIDTTGKATVGGNAATHTLSNGKITG